MVLLHSYYTEKTESSFRGVGFKLPASGRRSRMIRSWMATSRTATVPCHIKYIHYDPLMMSQKEAPRRHPWVLHGKVAKMVWIPVQFSFVEYDGYFLCASYYVLAAVEGSTHNYLLMAGNLHQIGYFSRKHPWVLPGCFLLWHHQWVIVGHYKMTSFSMRSE